MFIIICAIKNLTNIKKIDRNIKIMFYNIRWNYIWEWIECNIIFIIRNKRRLKYLFEIFIIKFK